MVKLTTLLTVLILVVLSCTQSSKQREAEQPSDSATSRSSQQGGLESFDVEKIDIKIARKHYKDHFDKIKGPERRRIHYCDSISDTLRYARFLRGTINDSVHIPDFDTTKLIGFTSNYTGIRLYPFLAKGQNRYLMVYTLPVTPSDRTGYQRDDTTTFYIVKVKADWCKLEDHTHPPKSNYLLLRSHRLCDPDCPQGDQAALR